MNQVQWSRVDDYFTGLLVTSNPVLDATLQDGKAAGVPPAEVVPNRGTLLQLFVRTIGARTSLEVGTLGSCNTIWLARALLKAGRLSENRGYQRLRRLCARHYERSLRRLFATREDHDG